MLIRCISSTVAMLLAGTVCASVIRHDQPDSAYTSLAAQPSFASAGLLTFNGSICSGTLIAPGWFLTAAHCVTNSSGQIDIVPAATTIRIGLDTRTVTNVVVHPQWTGSNYLDGVDLALVRLSSDITSSTPATISTITDVRGRTAIFHGFGTTGTGDLGVNPAQAAGTARAFTNFLDAIGPDFDPGLSSAVVLADFDSPVNTMSFLGGPDPTTLEGNIAAGDSGGGIFIPNGSVYELAGVSSFSFTSQSVIPTGPSGYGSGTAGTLLAPHRAWIDSTIPVPTTGTGFLLAMISFVRPRSRR